MKLYYAVYGLLLLLIGSCVASNRQYQYQTFEIPQSRGPFFRWDISQANIEHIKQILRNARQAKERSTLLQALGSLNTVPFSPDNDSFKQFLSKIGDNALAIEKALHKRQVGMQQDVTLAQIAKMIKKLKKDVNWLAYTARSSAATVHDDNDLHDLFDKVISALKKLEISISKSQRTSVENGGSSSQVFVGHQGVNGG